MRTALEILKSEVSQDCIWEDHLDNIPMDDVVRIMKIYANYKLDLASEEATTDYGMVDRSSILSLKDGI